MEALTVETKTKADPAEASLRAKAIRAAGKPKEPEAKEAEKPEAKEPKKGVMQFNPTMLSVARQKLLSKDKPAWKK